VITSRHIQKVIWAAVLTAVLVLGILAAFSNQLSSGISLSYEQKLFDTDQVMTVNILIDEDEWDDLLETAISETYYCCDIEINGETYYRVGIRAKGNTSLSMVASSDSDRYSFKVKFDEYVDGQTCYGLDKLVLNNNYSDATMMKEAVVYDMFAFLDVDASLYNYARISVNGEYWGVYLALEAVEESFALRNYGTHYGNLYKPDSMEMGGAGRMKDVDLDQIEDWFGFGTDESGQSQAYKSGNADFSGGTFDFPGGQPPQLPQGMEDFTAPPDGLDGFDSASSEDAASQQADGGPDGTAAPQQEETGNPDSRTPWEGSPNFGGGTGGFGSGSAAALNYIDDDLDSYSVIWDSQVFSSTKSDHKRVVQALKNISEGTNLEQAMDVDSVLRYMAVQTFVVNLDGLSGNMAHNYYLYEKNGQLSLIPWDYNLAFGGFQSSDASSTINFPVDTPFSSGVSTEDRQFFMALLNVEEYREQYHAYLSQLVEEYVDGGRFDEVYQRIRSQIDTLVADDPTSFYTYEEYDQAAQMLYQTVLLRAESVKGQIGGNIPATTAEQQENPSLLMETSSIDLSVMGSMMGGRGGVDENGGRGGIPGFFDPRQDGTGGEDTQQNSTADDGTSPQGNADSAVSGPTSGEAAPAAPDNSGPAALPSGENATRPPQQNGEIPAPNQSGQGMPQNGGGMLPNRGEAGAAMESLPSQEQEPSSSESTEVSGAENDSGAAESSAWNGGNAGRQGGKPGGQMPGGSDMPAGGTGSAAVSAQSWLLLGGCLLLIALAVFAAAKYRR
jgi:spore coat protein CotH